MDIAILKLQIKQLAQTYQQENIINRRYLHQHPELSYQEFNTSLYIPR